MQVGKAMTRNVRDIPFANPERRICCGIALLWGGCTSALIGLLPWGGSAEAPEDPVLPPPGQKRGRRWGEPRERR